jgi:hypothetical protein
LTFETGLFGTAGAAGGVDTGAGTPAAGGVAAGLEETGEGTLPVSAVGPAADAPAVPPSDWPAAALGGAAGTAALAWRATSTIGARADWAAAIRS